MSPRQAVRCYPVSATVVAVGCISATLGGLAVLGAFTPEHLLLIGATLLQSLAVAAALLGGSEAAVQISVRILRSVQARRWRSSDK